MPRLSHDQKGEVLKSLLLLLLLFCVFIGRRSFMELIQCDRQVSKL